MNRALIIFWTDASGREHRLQTSPKLLMNARHGIKRVGGQINSLVYV